MELQQRVKDYISSIDTSDTILMITDAGKGNFLSDLTEYIPLLVDYLLLQTRNMTIRVGGESFRLAEMFLVRGENMLEHIANPKRFEIYTVQSNMKDSWATIIDMDNFHFDIESDFIQVAMKYFRGHMVPYYVNHNATEMQYICGSEELLSGRGLGDWHKKKRRNTLNVLRL